MPIVRQRKKEVITIELLKIIFNRAIDESSRVLSKIFKAGAKIETINMDISNMGVLNSEFKLIAGEQVGSFVYIGGQMPMYILFMVDKSTSLTFTDLFLKLRAGSTSELDFISISVMHELGNIVGSAVANMIFGDLGFEMLPTPPKVLTGEADKIMLDFLKRMGEGDKKSESIYVIETVFNIVRYRLSAKLLLVPEIETFPKLNIDLGV